MNLSDRANGSTALRRAYPAAFEVRGKSGSTVGIRGYATVYEQPYEMYDYFGSYFEVMEAGSGKTTLSQNPRTQLLLNHAGLSMAYTRAGTLTLTEDSTGLEVNADLDVKRNDVHDMVQALERGDVAEMSFAFRVMRQKWSPDYDERRIVEYNIDRGDVSVVNFGANPNTEVGLRAQDFDTMDDTAARALYERLSTRFAVVGTTAGTSLSLAEAQLRLMSL